MRTFLPRLRSVYLYAFPFLVGSLMLGSYLSRPGTAAVAPGEERPIAANALTLPPGAHLLGRLPANTPLHIGVGLALHQGAVLDLFLHARSDPRSPFYRRTLTPAQFTDLFGPTAAEEASVIGYLRAHGLRVTGTYANRLLIDADGTAAQVGAAFSVRLVRYRDRHGALHFANATIPQLPTALSVVVSAVVGLRDDMPVSHIVNPLLGPSAHPHRGAQRVSPRTRLIEPPGGTLVPAQLRAAYDFSPIYTQAFTAANGVSTTVSITGAGQTIALYELSPYDPTDIATYDAVFGITATAPLSIPVHGGAVDTFHGFGTGEAALDIEMVQAIAPGAQILVYHGPSSQDSANNTLADDIYARIIADNRAQILSTSWGQCEPDQLASSPPDITLLHTLFGEAVAQGMTIVAASADSGANDCTDGRPNPSVDYPASDPYVIAVGGTTLLADPAGSVVTESAWSGSGGGPSAYFPRPSWQSGPGLLPSSWRQVPDVALNAGTAYAVWVSGGWNPLTGTSGGVPIWAALLALTNQTRYVAAQVQGAPTPQPCALVAGLGDLHTALYTLAATPPPTPVFRDITAGFSNGLASPGVGWDGVTGLGVPDAYALLRALIALPQLAAPTPGPCPSVTSTPVVTSTSTALPLTTATPLVVTATPLAAGAAQATPGAGGDALHPARHQVLPPLPTLAVRIFPSQVYAGEIVTVQVRLATAPQRWQPLIVELRYPGQSVQRVRRLAPTRGPLMVPLRAVHWGSTGRPVVVRVQVMVRMGRRTLYGVTSLRVLPLPIARSTHKPSHGVASPPLRQPTPLL